MTEQLALISDKDVRNTQIKSGDKFQVVIRFNFNRQLEDSMDFCGTYLALMAITECSVKNYKNAIKMGESARLCGSTHPDLQAVLANSYFALNDYDMAKKYYKEILEQKGLAKQQIYGITNALVVIASRQSDTDSFVKYLALGADNGNSVAAKNLANYYAKTGDSANARKYQDIAFKAESTS
jgi:tetratricopeptide (TPR) repeat protein